MSNDGGHSSSSDTQGDQGQDKDPAGVLTSSSDDDDQEMSASSEASESCDKPQDTSDPCDASASPPVPGSPSGAAATAAFSVAQALNMVRQRREEQQLATKRKESELEAQRLEKAREKRRRRRRNQKLRKAQSKQDAGIDSGNTPDTSSPSAKPDDAPSDTGLTLPADGSSQASGCQHILSASKELKRSTDDEDGDAMLKRLPVKKRIKLQSTRPRPAQTQADDKATDCSNTESRGPISQDGELVPPTSAGDSRVENGNSKVLQINRLIPRALLLKMSKANK